MQEILFSSLIVKDPLEEASKPTLTLSREQVLKGSSLHNPLGQDCAKGYVLLSKSQLDSLDLNALHTLSFKDDKWQNTVTLHNLVITREPVKVHYSMTEDDAQSVYLVEVSDRRWLCHNPYFCYPINKLYNVRARGWRDTYYTNSTNGGTAWTWTGIAENIWNLMSGQLGSYPGLPSGVSPTGTPEHWIFQGQSAWLALCEFLTHLGCAVKCDLTQSSSQYSIVRLGVADGSTTQLLNSLDTTRRKLHDGEYQTVKKGRQPYGVKVHFHALWQDYGTEPTTDKDSDQWLTRSVYTVDVAGPDTTNTITSLYTPIWSDVPAVYDSTGSLTNGATLSTIASELKDSYFRWLEDPRDHRVYDGANALSPGGTIRSVTWRLTGQGAVVTEIVRHPFTHIPPSGMGGNYVDWEDGSTSRKPGDYRPTYPNYPPITQVIEIANGTPSSNLYQSTVELTTTAPSTFSAQETVSAFDLGGATSLTVGAKYLARLTSWDTGNTRPVYSFDSRGSSSITGITIKAADGTPSYSGITAVQFDEADGYDITFISATEVRIDHLPATPTQAGIVSTSAQGWAGTKTFINDGLGGNIITCQDTYPTHTDFEVTFRVFNSSRWFVQRYLSSGNGAIFSYFTANDALSGKYGLRIESQDASSNNTFPRFAVRDGFGDDRWGGYAVKEVVTDVQLIDNGGGNYSLSATKRNIPFAGGLYVGGDDAGGGSGGSGGGSITSTGVGTDSGKSVSSLSITGVSTETDDLLLVAVGCATGLAPTVTYDGVGGFSAADAIMHTGGADMQGAIYYKKITGNTTGDIAISLDGSQTWAVACAVKVSGLSTTNKVNSGTEEGTGTNPLYSGAAVAAERFILSVVITNGPEADDDGTWQLSFTDGQHDGTTGGADDTNGRLCEGRLATSTTLSSDIEKTGITSRDWLILWTAHE